LNLLQLFSRFPFPVQGDITEIAITGLAADSRRVQPGNLFIAMTGGAADGHRFIPQAVEKGAAAVVGEAPYSEISVPYLRVPNSRQALAYLAAAWNGFPAHHLTVIGVTGTDGKTTTCNLIYSILKEAGIQAGMISTVNALIGDKELDTGFHVTTPDATDVQRYLAQMVQAGLTHVVLEATSHGLAQFRVDACEFDIGIVTNITHEHLDFHQTYEAYRAAKGRLFQMLEETPIKPHNPPRAAVLNMDDQSYAFLNLLSRVNVISYGLAEDADLRAENARTTPEGIRFSVAGSDLRFPVQARLVGLFNVSNCLAAIAATTLALGLDPEAAWEGIARFQGVPGRMELIDLGQDFTVVVDFAHTPNALRVALTASRQMTDGKLIAVFGSAGLRDREKRRMMAETSVELADITILTAEDPRTEPLDQILQEMADGAIRLGAVEGETFLRVRDRGEAIRKALSLAKAGDLVISCGKGHEQSMCFATTEYLWDDRTAVRAALSEYLGIAGPQMPYLPTQECDERWV
jgi:UDP-N-acetylmuramoyl-L-alanyl-D-glutamate--2,6-diaminopimelate ligase